MNAPCKDCQDRVLGCHSVCEKYKTFLVENEKRKEAIWKDKEINEHFKHIASMRRVLRQKKKY